MWECNVTECMKELSGCEDEDIKDLRDCCFTNIVVNGRTQFLLDSLQCLTRIYRKKTNAVSEDEIIDFAKNHCFTRVSQAFFKGNVRDTEEFLKAHHMPYERKHRNRRKDYKQIEEFAPNHTCKEIAQVFFRGKIRTARTFLATWSIAHKGVVCGRKPKNHAT